MNRVEPALETQPRIEFLDFIPKITDRIPLEGRLKYDKFQTLIDRANFVLSKRQHCRVICIESVQVSTGSPLVPSRDGVQCTDEFQPPMKFTVEDQKHYSTYIRGLRIWIDNSWKEDSGMQVIKYFSIVPTLHLVSGSGGCKYLTQGISALIGEANEYISTHDIRGHFAGAEVIPVNISSDRVSPEMCAWTVGPEPLTYVDVLRVFYLKNDTERLTPNLDYVDISVNDIGTEKSELGNSEKKLEFKVREWLCEHHQHQILQISTSPPIFCRDNLVSPQKTDRNAKRNCFTRIIFCHSTATRQLTGREFQSNTFVLVSLLPKRRWVCRQTRVADYKRTAIRDVNALFKLFESRNQYFRLVMAETLLCDQSEVYQSERLTMSSKDEQARQLLDVKCCRLYYVDESKA